nr:hypothetical protein [Tanacetum cinerariifolium]
LGYDGLTMMPEDPYAYVEAAMQEPPPLDFVLKPVYPEFMPPEDDVLPAEEQPLHAAVSPTADSPCYITEDDDDEEESFEDDVDDEEEDEDEEEEENLTPIPFLSETEVARLLSIPTPPPSPLTSYSSPLPQIPYPPLPASPTHPLGYRAAMTRLRTESPSTSHPLPLPLPIVLLHTRASMVMMRSAAPSTYILAPRSKTPPSGTPPVLPIPLPTSSPPFLLPSTNCRVDVLEVTLPPRKSLCIAIGPRFEIGECSSALTARPTRGFSANYGFVSTLDVEIRRDPDREIELSQRMTDFITTVRQDIDKIYGRLDNAPDDRLASREAWVQSMDASDTVRSEVRALQTMVLAQQTKKMEPTRRTTRVSPAMTTTTTPVINTLLKALIDQGVANALAARDVDRSQNGDDSHNLRTSSRRTEQTTRKCTYTDFLKCQPMNFKGTEGKSHVKTVGQDAAHSMSSNTLIKMIAKYCPRNGIKKLEMKIWELKVKESDKIEKYVGGLPDMIHGSVMASKPKTMQDEVEFATKLMDKKIHTFAERQTKNKRKPEDNSRNNKNQ